jgi:hypothetical protein
MVRILRHQSLFAIKHDGVWKVSDLELSQKLHFRKHPKEGSNLIVDANVKLYTLAETITVYQQGRLIH